nr:IS3 family transposase [Globicatella sulfidifaciens]
MEQPDVTLNRWFKLAELPKSSFYEWKNKLSLQDDMDPLVEEIKHIIAASNHAYGYRRVTIALKKMGYTVNHKRVLRIMRENHLLCVKFTRKNRRYRSFKGEVRTIAENHLNRNFVTTQPNDVWVSDVTEFKVANSEEKLYLSAIMDLYNSEIIAYSMSQSPTVRLTNQSLEEALTLLPDKHKLMIHTDQGFHYQHQSWVNLLKKHSICQSMSRRGNCLDNSPMENFFGLLKQEMYYGETTESIHHLKEAIATYIYWYNNERIKIKLNGLSPIQYRLQAA